MESLTVPPPAKGMTADLSEPPATTGMTADLSEPPVTTGVAAVVLDMTAAPDPRRSACDPRMNGSAPATAAPGGSAASVIASCHIETSAGDATDLSLATEPRKRSRSRSHGSRQPTGSPDDGDRAAGPAPTTAGGLGLPRWLRSPSRSRSRSADGDLEVSSGTAPGSKTAAVSSCKATAVSGAIGANASMGAGASAQTGNAGVSSTAFGSNAAAASSCKTAPVSGATGANASMGAAGSSATGSRRPDTARVVAKLRTVAAGDETRLALLTGIVCGRLADPQSFSRAEMDRELAPHIADARRLQELLQWLEQGQLDIGNTVQLQGLKAAPHLNGLIGRCQEWSGSNGRWEVRLNTGEVKSVKFSNLVFLGNGGESNSGSTSTSAASAAPASSQKPAPAPAPAPAAAAGKSRPQVSEAALNKLKKKAEDEARNGGPQPRRFGKEQRDPWQLPPRAPISFVAAAEKDAGPSRSVTVLDPRGRAPGDNEDSDEDVNPGRIALPVTSKQVASYQRPQRRVPHHPPAYEPASAPSPSPFEPSTSARYAPYAQQSVYSPPVAPVAQPAVYVEGEGAASLPVVGEERGGRYVTATPDQMPPPQTESCNGITPGPPPPGPPPTPGPPPPGPPPAGDLAGASPAAATAGASLAAPTGYSPEQQVPDTKASAFMNTQTGNAATVCAADAQDGDIKGNLYFAVSDVAREEDKTRKTLQEKRQALKESKTKILEKTTQQLQHCLARLQSPDLDEPTREKYQDLVSKLQLQMSKITDVA